ncbi:class D sortase [Piscibacillus halophilus]|uniref:class D sortase n=1 Tax=Piscibacillus halophilus TaxID=571933 RepID=UPI00240A6ECA|nr:class D sortase [Piscibacillus halophilus]
MKKLVAVLFIIMGIGIIAFPHVQNQLYASKEDELVREFQNLNQVFNQNQERSEIELEDDDHDVSETQNSSLDSLVIGLLHIEKIDLTVPMLQGASEENLDIGVGIMDGTDPLGNVGNTGIAGHRSYTEGRLFNRLDEISKGDEIIIETLDGEWLYEVFDTKIVTPDDVSVLEPMAEESIITLITCEPMYDPTHRIIVHAKKIDDDAS